MQTELKRMNEISIVFGFFSKKKCMQFRVQCLWKLEIRLNSLIAAFKQERYEKWMNDTREIRVIHENIH